MSTKKAENKIVKAEKVAYKVTLKTPVEELIAVLNTNFGALRKIDQPLAESIDYMGKRYAKDKNSVKKSEMVELAKQTIISLGDAFVIPKPAVLPLVKSEASLKPTKTPSKPKDEPKAEKPKAEKPEVSEKKALKTSDLATADTFPNELTVGDEVYKIAHEIKDMEGLLKAFGQEREVIFAFYWTKRHLKQFPYAMGTLSAPSAGFKDNLDLATCLYVSDEVKVCYALSMYTESLYQVMPEAFEELDGVRYSNGIDYQIYIK